MPDLPIMQPPPPHQFQIDDEAQSIRRSQVNQLIAERRADAEGHPRGIVRCDVKIHPADLQAGLVNTNDMGLLTDLDFALTEAELNVELARHGVARRELAEKREARQKQLEFEQRRREEIAVSNYIKAQAMMNPETKKAYEANPAGYERKVRAARDAEHSFYKECCERGVTCPRPTSRLTLTHDDGSISFQW